MPVFLLLMIIGVSAFGLNGEMVCENSWRTGSTMATAGIKIETEVCRFRIAK